MDCQLSAPVTWHSERHLVDRELLEVVVFCLDCLEVSLLVKRSQLVLGYEDDPFAYGLAEEALAT